MDALPILISGIFLQWLVLWILCLRHERRRAARGLPRHGALRVALAAAALLAVFFIAGTMLLLLTAHSDIATRIDWHMVGPYVTAVFAGSLAVAWLTLRRPA